MVLKVLGSSSHGNSYILENDREALLLEAGVRFASVKQALDYNITKVVGCLITHEHKDHAGYINEVLKATVPVYASAGTRPAPRECLQSRNPFYPRRFPNYSFRD